MTNYNSVKYVTKSWLWIITLINLVSSNVKHSTNFIYIMYISWEMWNASILPSPHLGQRGTGEKCGIWRT